MGRVAGQGTCLAGLALAGMTSVWPAFGEEAAPTYSDPVPVPSGQDVRWIETVRDMQGPEGLTLRFRFLAPAIAGADPVTPERAQDDMQALCDSFAVPRIPPTGPQPAQIVVSLSSSPVPFGAADDTVVQFFEAYSVVDGACVWDLF